MTKPSQEKKENSKPAETPGTPTRGIDVPAAILAELTTLSMKTGERPPRGRYKGRRKGTEGKRGQVQRSYPAAGKEGESHQ